MRGQLAHRYFDTSHAILQATVDHDPPKLGRALTRLDTPSHVAEYDR
jgi:hypothetical protein